MKNLIIAFFCLVSIISCKNQTDKLVYPYIISLKESFDTIIRVNSDKMLFSRPVIYGLNVKDTVDLGKSKYYKKNNFIGWSYGDKKIKTDSLIVFVDTSKVDFHTNLVDSNFSRNLPPPPPPPLDAKDSSEIASYKNKRASFLDEYMKAIDKAKRTHFELFPVYVYNYSNTNTVVSKPLSNGALYLIVEAKNKKQEWKPIEYWEQHSFLCGTGHQDYILKPKHFMMSSVRKYQGGYKTKMRVKLRTFENVFYSNEFYGYINYSQFDSNYVVNEIQNRYSNSSEEFRNRRLKLLFLDF